MKKQIHVIAVTIAPALAFAAILGAPAAPCLALGFAAGLAATLNP